MRSPSIEVEGIGFHRRGAEVYLTVQLGGDVFEFLERKLTKEELAYIIDEVTEVAEQLEIAKEEEGQMSANTYPDDLWDIRDIPKNIILRDWFNEGVRVILMRGPNSINVYFGIPLGHPLAGFYYENLPVSCHGGLTYGGIDGEEPWPPNYNWYGYDYGHANDWAPYYEDDSSLGKDSKRWTIGEVVQDIWGPLYDFKQLMRSAENIHKKAKG